ncbi:oxygen-dependent coproporphyrinogen oxidase [Marinoscillum sp. MHG1-6]|uniref:oxygen-dependent coproporphyrinogen oxidase n=1 Tax=Marinoscillum sp. MHG1-6 TaxID=2959627 RepID=UPI0021582C55|nr:oxygen-dependent coproporphyrinogen oxidase [Marinoscillum sp. MHG1-6]
MNKQTITDWFKELQDEICKGLEDLDGKSSFKEDNWQRPEGGGGRTRVIDDGNLIEKGGVNFSAVSGPTPKKILEALNLPETDFYATGVSIVLHPQNPWVPIIHMNVRYFEMGNGTYWFGGGIDLTPHYVHGKEDGVTIHSILKAACDQIDPEYYARFKSWADDYFFIRHRNETRGIGGIFFDRINEQSEGKSKEDLWQFVQSVGKSFVPIYSDYAQKHRSRSFNEGNKKWQFLRRGRYAEFNLVWDKGTKFGLDTNGRTESILMSLPPQCSWEYDHQPTAGSLEAETLNWLKKDIDWI